MIAIKIIAAVAVGYLLGCVSTGIITGKLLSDTDIRKEGSGNAGATNMLRTLGWLPSLITFAGDALKAVLACWMGSLLWDMSGAYIAGLACVIGHNWPVFFGFKGGKGVASSFGVLLFTCPVIAISVLVLEIIVVAATKMMSVASICAGTLNAIMSLILLRHAPFYLFCGLALTALLYFQHRSNIMRLIKNSENKLDFRKISHIDFRQRKGRG